MKSPFPKRAAGFTLVEMLVVIAIISLVATASIGAIKNAQRQARATRCAANMHALHQAVLSYYADTEHYPAAGAYETYLKTMGEDGKLHETFYQKRAWVNWVRASAVVSRRKSDGNLYGAGEATSKSQAGQYCYVGPGCGSQDYSGASGSTGHRRDVQKSRVYRSIDEGAIFKYADKSFSIYCCDEFKNKYGTDCMRSYAMNVKYGSRRKGYNRWELCKEAPGLANRLAMFVELGAVAGTRSGEVGGTTGTSGRDAAPANLFYNDSVWDWDNSNEAIGVLHRKAGKLYGHVIFADGHLESLQALSNDDREEIGKGDYGD